MPGDLQTDLQTLTQLREAKQANTEGLNRLSQEYVELTRPTVVASGGKSNQPLTERDKLKEEKAQLQDKLHDLLKRYTPSFPEAVETQTRLNQVEEQLKNLPAERAESQEAASPNASRIEVNRRSTERLNEEQKRITAQIADLEQKVAAVPLREQEFDELTRNYNVTKQDYQTIFQKEAQAEMTESLETEQGAERFVVLEPARPPERPYKPNRGLLLGMGLMASLTLSTGFVIGKEQLANTIKGEENLAACLPESVAVLASIPTILTERDTSRRRMFTGFAFCVLVVACFLVAVIFRGAHSVL
jgi:polysaccharide biosynthesis transport protein